MVSAIIGAIVLIVVIPCSWVGHRETQLVNDLVKDSLPKDRAISKLKFSIRLTASIISAFIDPFVGAWFLIYRKNEIFLSEFRSSCARGVIQGYVHTKDITQTEAGDILREVEIKLIQKYHGMPQ